MNKKYCTAILGFSPKDLFEEGTNFIKFKKLSKPIRKNLISIKFDKKGDVKEIKLRNYKKSLKRVEKFLNKEKNE